MKKEAKHTPGPILNDGETPKGLMLLAGPEDREDECWSCGPTEGEEIMVNTPYDVFILPLRPSGLNGNAPRFVVHVPQIEAQRPTGDGCHCATCTCEPNMTPAVRFDLSPAQKEGAIREHLIRLGWTPPDERALSKPAEHQAEVEALRKEVEEWKRVASAQAELHDEAEKCAEELAKALAGLITWIPSADTYRRLGFDPEAPMRALERAKLSLGRGGLSND